MTPTQIFAEKNLNFDSQKKAFFGVWIFKVSFLSPVRNILRSTFIKTLSKSLLAYQDSGVHKRISSD